MEHVEQYRDPLIEGKGGLGRLGGHQEQVSGWASKGQDALDASGSRGLAYATTVGNQCHLEGVDLLGFYHGFQDVVGVVGVYLGTNQAQAL